MNWRHPLHNDAAYACLLHCPQVCVEWNTTKAPHCRLPCDNCAGPASGTPFCQLVQFGEAADSGTLRTVSEAQQQDEG